VVKTLGQENSFGS